MMKAQLNQKVAFNEKGKDILKIIIGIPIGVVAFGALLLLWAILLPL